MNKLSWLLYWADTLPRLAAAIGITVSLLAIFSFLALGAHIISGLFYNNKEAEALNQGTKLFRWLFPALVLLWWVTYIVPSRETFYAIAVSEVGETVLDSPEVGKARKALNAWLDKQIESEEAEENTEEGEKQ